MNCPAYCNRSLQKYLSRRAIKSPWEISNSFKDDFSAVIVIPALAESKHLPRTLSCIAKNPREELSKTLVVVVVNNVSGATAEQKENNCETLRWLHGVDIAGLNLSWVDACSTGLELPDKDGVGLARKIGFDLSLPLLNWGELPILVSLDADTLVDANYLPAIFAYFREGVTGGAVLPYRHQFGSSTEEEFAIRKYELYLRSYLFGLGRAGSPYAYHTIGSALACRSDAYIAAAGMSRRKAGEDFYFLQQLAKTSGIGLVKGTVVKPSARFSSRVPFGTGKVVQAQVQTNHFPCQYISLAAFKVLQDWLVLVANNWNTCAAELIDQAKAISPILFDFLQGLKFTLVWERLQLNSVSQGQMLSAFNLWFDALRTRQLLTRLEDGANLSTANLVAELLAWGGYQGVDTEAEQLQLLEHLQGVFPS